MKHILSIICGHGDLQITKLSREPSPAEEKKIDGDYYLDVTDPANIQIKEFDGGWKPVEEIDLDQVFGKKPKTVEVTAQSVAQVVAAITRTGPEVDRKTYRAHVPKFVTKDGKLTQIAIDDPNICEQPKKPLTEVEMLLDAANHC